MSTVLRRRFAGALGVVALLASFASAAQQQPAANAAPAGPDALAGFGRVLDESALEAHRGGQDDAFFNDMRSRATISQTSTSNLTTGTNAISEGAFTNSNGLPMVIQNTGNNVVIQNSTILNLQLR